MNDEKDCENCGEEKVDVSTEEEESKEKSSNDDAK